MLGVSKAQHAPPARRKDARQELDEGLRPGARHDRRLGRRAIGGAGRGDQRIDGVVVRKAGEDFGRKRGERIGAWIDPGRKIEPRIPPAAIFGNRAVQRTTMCDCVAHPSALSIRWM